MYSDAPPKRWKLANQARPGYTASPTNEHSQRAPGAQMDLRLHGKTAIVTGSSCGISKASAREPALEGMDVVIAAVMYH